MCSAAPADPVPGKELWEANMLSYGRLACDNLQSAFDSFDDELASTYYDAPAVFYQISEYTKDESWRECAKTALTTYRDKYVQQYAGVVPGYWNFTYGLLLDYLNTGNLASRDILLTLSQVAAFAADWTPLAWTKSSLRSREVAYAILSYLDAETAGAPLRPRVFELVDQALGHMQQWRRQRAPYMRPFMVGLTMQALISYFERTGDPRIPPAIARMLDWLWESTWVNHASAFKYTDRKTSTGGTAPAPDLNLLIAPAYAWAYRLSGQPRFKRRGDLAFLGGVTKAFLNNNKQFQQNYRWSFRYLEYREG